MRFTLPATLALFATLASLQAGGDGKSLQALLQQPLSKVDALNLALAHNGTILQAQKDVEAATGVAIQTKAIVFPQVIQTGHYSVRQDSLIEANQNASKASADVTLPGLGTLQLGGGDSARVNNQVWGSEIQVVQSIYEGGRMLSAVRSSRLIREQSVLIFRSTVADMLLSVSNNYDNVLRAAKQIEVREAAVKFLGAYLDQTKIKNAAGAAPEFDVLRQEVEVANAEAERVRAVGEYRVAKQTLVELLGQDLPTSVSDDIALDLTTPLAARPYPKNLPAALAEAVVNRTEIAALQKEVLLRSEAIVVAKAGNKPSVQAFGGYQMTSQVQSRNAGDEVHGGLAGVQVGWPIFDGFLTQGRVAQAVALKGKALAAEAETTRVVERQVRSAWTELRTARAVLDAQSKNADVAVRALELAQIRYNEGAGTQIDVLNAQCALTQARGLFVNALSDYSTSRARLIRATGSDLQTKSK